jgi:glycosyltransferase involved in cell wall biosynthesis
MKVLFVGPVSGYTSYPVVCKGLLQALVLSGIKPMVADTTSDGSVNHTISSSDISDKITWLSQKEIAGIVKEGRVVSEYGKVCIAMNPTHILFDIKESGMKVVGIHVGDVDSIPGAWKALMVQEDLILTPSKWCKSVIEKSEIKTPIMVLNHGIGEDFINYPVGDFEQEFSRLDSQPISFLHFCAAVFYPERKATPQVLKAFERLVNDGEKVFLKLVFGLKTKPVKKIIRSIPKHVRKHMEIHFHEGGLPQEEIIKIYRASHFLLAPSRAEGMGMMPLECRALGVPVMQTLCTGHADHLKKFSYSGDFGVMPVKHGNLVPAWGKFGKAPEVTVDAIYNSMKFGIRYWKMLKTNAFDKINVVRRDWSWQQVTQPLVDWLNQQ